MIAYALLILLGFGVVARVTRFVNTDVLAAPLRIRVYARFGPTGRMATLVECPWCLSIWVGAAVAGAATYLAVWPLPGWAIFTGLWLSWSYAYGLLAQSLDGKG